LANALKVQPSDMPIVLELAACPPRATITVQHRGPGIDPEVLPTLLQRFLPALAPSASA
jgi:signal transduction histidine kinase